MATVEFLLAGRTNPHSRVRDNGVRWWGYPSRRGGTDAIRCIAVHTAETDPTATSAQTVASWQAYEATVPSSYHVLVDSDHTVRTVLDSQVAFHVGGFNTPSLGLSFATRAAWWDRNPTWDQQALARAADQARIWCKDYNIPRRWLTRTQALAGQAGFVRHSVMDPSRRSDPGAKFPAQTFFDLIAQEDLMATLDAEDLAAIAEAVTRSVWTHPVGKTGETHTYQLSRVRADAAAARALVEGLASDA